MIATHSQRQFLGRLLYVLDALLDEKVGVLETLEELKLDAGSPDFFHYYCKAANTAAFTDQDNFGITGGAATSKESAMAKAIGEAIERYCSAIYDARELPVATSRSAPFRCVAPQDFAIYSESQYARPGFPFAPFGPETPVRWTPMTDLSTGQSWYVPAAMVYMPYYYHQGDGDTPIIQPISTGLACHCSLTEAAIGALCEVVERDALMITWQAKLAHPHIRVETLSDANYDRVQRFERAGSEVTLLDITLDGGVPTVLSLLRSSSSNLPAFVIAGSCSPDPEEAVRKSLEELAHTFRYSRQIKSYLPPFVAAPPDHENVVDQVAHLHYWGEHENLPQAEFLYRSKVRKDFDQLPSHASSSPRQELKSVCEAIARTGHQPLVADLTSADMRALGFTVVKAIIPGYQPLFMGYGVRALGGRRLWELPGKLGFEGIDARTGDCPYPHPYP